MEEPTKLKNIKNRLENNWFYISLFFGFALFAGLVQVVRGFKELKTVVQPSILSDPTAEAEAPISSPPSAEGSAAEEIPPGLNEILNAIELHNYEAKSKEIQQYVPLDYTVFSIRNKVTFNEGTLGAYLKNLAFAKSDSPVMEVVKIDREQSFIKINVKK